VGGGGAGCPFCMVGMPTEYIIFKNIVTIFITTIWMHL